MDDNQGSQFGSILSGSAEGKDHPFTLLSNGLHLVLEGEGKERPETWNFYQRTLAFEHNVPDGRNDDTSVTIFKNFLNKKLVKYRIIVVYNGNSNDIIVCCDKLIDHVILALDAGEDLRLTLNEIKEEFINKFISKQKAFENFKKEMLIKIDSARGPDGSNLLPIDVTVAADTAVSLPVATSSSFAESLLDRVYEDSAYSASYADQAQQGRFGQ